MRNINVKSATRVVYTPIFGGVRDNNDVDTDIRGKIKNLIKHNITRYKCI